MLYCENYKSYKGPPLIKAVLGDEDITEEMIELYGENFNWKGYLWTFKEAFGEKSLNKNFRFDNHSINRDNSPWIISFIK